MAKNCFRFKQFTIYQDLCAMKVGTDGVLLGAWADCSGVTNVLDIGTGTGLIALMIAQRSPAVIHAVEIERNAYLQALENIKSSPWESRITIGNISFQEFARKTSERYDLIITNPPYFSESLKSSDERRNIARHNDRLPVADLIKGVSLILKKEGRFCLILPADRKEEFLGKAREEDLFVAGILNIRPTPQKEPKRMLLEMRKISSEFKEESLVVECGERHLYSDEYKMLTKEFYLSF